MAVRILIRQTRKEIEEANLSEHTFKAFESPLGSQGELLFLTAPGDWQPTRSEIRKAGISHFRAQGKLWLFFVGVIRSK